MKIFLTIGLVVAAGCLQAASAGSRLIKSSTEANGNQHPATAALSGPASITCTSVGGTNATCYITGPGIEKQVPKNANVLTIGAGKVTLICNGSGSLTCEARIDTPIPGQKSGADK
jgi:hypothetical protein